VKHLLLWVALCWGLTACSPPQPFHHTDLSGATFAAEFPRALADQGGQLRRLADFRGRVVILFFGYTSCPDICPTALARFAAVREALGEERQRLQVLFVTLDPERDSVARLKDYAVFFHPKLKGLTGTPAEIAAIAHAYGASYSRQEVKSEGGYVVDHSSFVYLLAPDGRLAASLPHGTTPEDMAAAMRRLLPQPK